MKISLLTFAIFTTVTFAAMPQVDTIFISVNTTWNKGTIQCDTTIVVDSGVTLSVEPGARCLFAPGIKLICRGKLIAKGSPTDSIYFTSSQPPLYWGGITLTGNGADNSTLEFCRVTYSGQPHGGGLCSKEAKTIISYSHFANDSSGYDGGAIYVENDTLEICSTAIINNKAFLGYGGGIYCKGRLNMIHNIFTNNISIGKFGGGAMVFGTCFIFKCEFTGNTANNAGFGGGLICQTDTAIITGNTFTQNSASNGGALYSKNYTVIENNAFTSNRALEPIGIGGAVSCNGTTIISGNTFISNCADSGIGGAIYVTGISSVLLSNTIRNNTAYQGGGGVQIATVTSQIINNCITNNTALMPQSMGGGILLNTKTEIFANNTIANNIADSSGGIYFMPVDTPVLINSIVWGNKPDQITPGSSILGSYCCIQNGWPGTSVITSYPLFADSSNGDYTVKASSPCINNGTPDTTGLSLPLLALNSVSRVIHGRIDIGACEYDGPTEGAVGNLFQKSAVSINMRFHNSHLQIYSNLPFPEKVRIELYSMQGKCIKILYNSTMPAGRSACTVAINHKNHAKGMYFIRVQAGEFELGQKVIFLQR